MAAARRLMRTFMVGLMAGGAAMAALAPVQMAQAQAPIAAPAMTPEDVARYAPPAPDYGDPANWAAGPALGVAAALPAGASPVAAHPAVDVFYIHPTTFRGERTQLNQDTRDAKANQWADESAVARQGGVFSGCCRVFSPRYRAAAYTAFANPALQSAAFALAYTDVERAFDWYLKHENHGRPFIIAGHSQGAFHIATLLEKRIDGTPLQKQMVAAYIIGINIAEGEFGRRFHNIGICDTPAQTGCALQWNSLLDGSDIPLAASRYEATYIPKYGDNPGKLTLCINPVTFDRRKPASLSVQAKGAVPGAPGLGAMQPLRAGAVAARCDHGMLVVDLAPGLGMDALPGGVMHYHDFGLFYADIRANAKLRADAFVKAHGAHPGAAR